MKETYTGLEQVQGEYIFDFLVNYPFNVRNS